MKLRNRLLVLELQAKVCTPYRLLVHLTKKAILYIYHLILIWSEFLLVVFKSKQKWWVNMK